VLPRWPTLARARVKPDEGNQQKSQAGFAERAAHELTLQLGISNTFASQWACHFSAA
jgi:hypothetical protein